LSSSAEITFSHVERYTNTLFVGEPSGSKGNTYGDSRQITLPNSGITVRVSIYYWQDWYPWDERRWSKLSSCREWCVSESLSGSPLDSQRCRSEPTSCEQPEC